jgi:hypothetical protein
MCGRLTKFQLRVSNWVGAQKQRQRTFFPSARTQHRIADANWQFFRLMLLFVKGCKFIYHFCVITATYCCESQSRLSDVIILIDRNLLQGRNGSMLRGSLVTAAWLIVKLRMEETTYWEWLQIHWLMNHWQPTRCGHPACILNRNY